MILQVFDEKRMEYLWEYGDLLYTFKNYNYLHEYIKIIQDKSYGTSRQMIVLLVGKSKKPEVIPILKKLLQDSDVYGHALHALTNFSGDDIEEIMQEFSTHKQTWVRNAAKKYLKKLQKGYNV